MKSNNSNNINCNLRYLRLLTLIIIKIFDIFVAFSKPGCWFVLFRKKVMKESMLYFFII